MKISHGRIVKRKFMIYWKKNLKWTLKTFATEQARRTMKKKKISLPTVAQFSFSKDETNILQNCKKLKNTKVSIFENLSGGTAAIHKEK